MSSGAAVDDVASIAALTTSSPPVSAEVAAVERAGRGRQAVMLVSALLRHHRRTFFVAVAGASVYALCTVLSAAVIRLVIDRVITPRFTLGHVSGRTVAWVLAMVVLVSVTRAAGVVVRRVWAGRTAWRVNESLAGSVIGRLVEQPVPWHRRQQAGELVSRAGLDAEAAIHVLNPLPFASSVVLMLIIAAAWMVATDVILGLGAVLLFPLLIALNVVYQKRVDKLFDAAQETIGELSAAVHESFDGVTVVKSLGAEQRETDRLAVIAARLRDHRLSIVKLRSIFEALLDAIPSLANMALLVGGALRVRAGDLTVGELTSFFYLFALLVFPLRLIGYALSELPYSLAGWKRVRSVTDEAVHPDPAAARTLTGGDVLLDDVTYSHDGERAVLAGLQTSIPAGRTVAVVGATGAGKTTLLHLIAGLIAPQRGRVGVPPGEVALVFQEAFLMADSVAENIAMGRHVSDDEVGHALRVAAAEFCHELPNGLATELGERGVGLSGGQRQRIALARALVGRPRVLLLDDTTSALDPTTEAVVLGNLRRWFADTTVVAVASRPSTIALADDVLFLDEGRIVDHGRHDELLAAHADYRRLIEAFEHDRAEHERAEHERDRAADEGVDR